MKIYEVEIAEENPTPLSSQIKEKFVVLAEDFDEAKEKVDKYLEKETKLIIHSITEKYIIKMGL